MTPNIEDFYVDVGKRVRTIRISRSMTQEQLGQALRPPTTRASIANIEAGKQRVLSHTLVQLSEGLGVDIHQVLPQSKALLPNKNQADIAQELAKKLQISKTEADKFVRKIANPKGKVGA